MCRTSPLSFEWSVCSSGAEGMEATLQRCRGKHVATCFASSYVASRCVATSCLRVAIQAEALAECESKGRMHPCADPF